MFRVATLFVLSACITLGISTRAQEMVVPSPYGRFTAHAEIVSVSPIVDNETRTIHIFHNERWESISYPSDLSSLIVRTDYDTHLQTPDMATLSDGTRVFAEGRIGSFGSDYQAALWQVSPRVSSLQPFRMRCPDSDASAYRGSLGSRVDLFNLEEAWITVQDQNNVYFCHVMTGQQSPVFGTQKSWSDPHVSPDGRYLVFEEKDPNDYNAPQYVYSYDTQTRELRLLGELERPEFHPPHFAYWLSETHFAMTWRDDPEWSSTYVYVGDASRLNSLEYAISRQRYAPEFWSNPLSLEVMGVELSDGPDDGPCILSVYTVETMEREFYDTGTLCEQGIPIPDGSGDRLYRSVQPEAQVVRFNYRTGDRRVLYTGEVETIGPTSPIGKYALIGLTADGIVNNPQDPMPDDTWGMDYPYYAVVMRLTDGSIIGRLPNDAFWFTDTLLLHRETLYRITERGIVKASLPGQLLLSYSNRYESRYKVAYSRLQAIPPISYLILWRPDQSIWFYDPNRKQAFPLLQLQAGETVNVEALGKNRLRVTLYQPQPYRDDLEDWQQPIMKTLWSVDIQIR